MKQKILIDARCVGGEGQGMLTYLKGLYNALYETQGEHYEFHFAGYDREAIQNAFPFVQAAHIHLLENHSRWRLFLWEYPRLLRKLDIDWAHFQYVTPFIKMSRQIVTTHDVLFLDFKEEFSAWYRWQRKLLFRSSLYASDIRLTVSEYSQQKIAQHFELPAATLSITPNAVPAHFFQSYNQKTAQSYIAECFGAQRYWLYVSRIEKRKNHELLLRAFADLSERYPQRELVLIGNNTLEDTELEELIQTYQKRFPNRIHWYKNVSDSDLLLFYRAADLFVYPSKAEGFGIPPLEAAAAGIPTICANNTALSDFTFFQDNLFMDNDLADLKKCIIQHEEQPQSPVALAGIKRRIQQKYNWNNSAAVLHRTIQITTTAQKHQKTKHPYQKTKITAFTSLFDASL
ncbi:MAG: glycosyltransferase family 4 protein [Saprospiraceae bacterium]